MGNAKLGVDLAFNADLLVTYQGDLKTVADRDNVIQAVRMRLDTPLGALFYDSSYGNPVLEMLSENLDSTWPGRATRAIKECLDHEPRIAAPGVQPDIIPEARKAVFNITFQILDDPRPGNLVWEVEIP